MSTACEACHAVVGVSRPRGDFIRQVLDSEHGGNRAEERCFVGRLGGVAMGVGQRLKAVTLTGTAVDLVLRLRGSHPTHPQTHHDVRLVGQWNELHQEWHLHVTSLLDPVAYPVALLVELYPLRWQIETFFRDLSASCGSRISSLRPRMVFASNSMLR